MHYPHTCPQSDNEFVLFISIVNWWYSTFRMQLKSHSLIRWKGDKELKSLKQVIWPESRCLGILRCGQVGFVLKLSEPMKGYQSRKRWEVLRLLQCYLQLTAQWLNGHLLPLCCWWSDEEHTPLLGTGKCVLRLLWGTEVAEWSKVFPSPSLFQGHCTCCV